MVSGSGYRGVEVEGLQVGGGRGVIRGGAWLLAEEYSLVLKFSLLQ